MHIGQMLLYERHLKCQHCIQHFWLCPCVTFSGICHKFELILFALTKGGLSIFMVKESIGVNVGTFIVGIFLRLVSSEASKHFSFIDNVKMKYLFILTCFT